MPTPVSDSRSHGNNQIASAAEFLRRAPRCLKVFKAIYRGKQRAKTAADIAKVTGLSEKEVLDAGKKIANNHLVDQVKLNGRTAYQKDPFIAGKKDKIIRLAESHKNNIKKIPTSYAPHVSSVQISVRLPTKRFPVQEIDVKDFDQFSKTRSLKKTPKVKISEKSFKAGLKKLLGDSGDHPDWGGEKNDLCVRTEVKGSRRRVAFAFKGPGTSGILTPGKLGKNGDQIQRLCLDTLADVFVIQYHGQIADSVVEQMESFARLRAFKDEKKIYFGIIDGDDTNRLLAAYPAEFGLRRST
jgi:hypothetical protein